MISDPKPRLDYATPQPKERLDVNRVAFAGFMAILFPIVICLVLGGIILLAGILRSIAIGS
jgi:hypothetical protein